MLGALSLWTVRSAEHYDRARGPLRAGVRHVDPHKLPAYRWMAAQLRRRVGPPPRGVVLPRWAWVEKPDLRENAHLARGTAGVVLESREMDPRHHGPASKAVRQAVFWELRREQLLSERRFAAR